MDKPARNVYHIFHPPVGRSVALKYSWSEYRKRERIEKVTGSLLFQVGPYDSAIATSAVGVLMAFGAAACLLPARRALRWNRCRPCEENKDGVERSMRKG
jgi:hypothetical protein